MSEAEILLLFGDNLRRIMKEKKITGCALERITGINRTQIAKYRRGDMYPTVRNMAKLCAALNISPGELYEVIK